MSDTAARAARIEEAAFAVLQEAGFQGASMLKIAKRAKASNETLYNWYGDKVGLFRALVTRNAEEIAAELRSAIGTQADPVQSLSEIGPHLLRMLTGLKAIALNRAAAADASGELGQALAEAGRGVVAPLIADLLEAAGQAGQLPIRDPVRAADLFVDLLVGDLQIRRVIGALPPPSEPGIRARAEAALRRFQIVLAAEPI